MHYISYKQRRFIRWLLLSLLTLVLAACSSSSAPDLTTDTPAPDTYAYVAKADVSEGMTQAEVEAMYGGSAILFKPEAGFAVLGFSEDEAALTTLSTDPNEDAFSAPVTAQGWDAWAGGWDAWAGGWDAWAGGWDAWAGGHGAWSGGHGAWSGGHGAWSGGHGAWSGGHGAWSGGESQNGPASNKNAFAKIKLGEAHALSRNFGNGVTVAVIDTGVDLDHTMFGSRLTASSTWKDYIDGDSYPQEASTGSAKGHGTAAAGIVLQVAPQVKILPLRVLDKDGKGDTDDIILAIDRAVSMGADVINLSAGANVYVAAMQAMVDYANDQGVYVVASAGNHGPNGVTTYPAKSSLDGDYKKLISVGSINASGQPSSFSSYGGALHYFAPGEDIRSAFPGNKTAKAKGTSFAAPMVSGSLALAKGEVSSSYHDRLNKYLEMSAVDGAGLRDGVLNVAQLIRSLPGFSEPVYQLVAKHSNKCVEAYGSNSNVYQYTCDGFAGQLWKLQVDGDTFKITNNASGRVLDVQGTTTAEWSLDGQNIIQATDTNNNPDKRWYLNLADSGYQLASAASGKCLDISGASTNDSANVLQWSCHDGANQTFEIRRHN